MLLLAWMLTQMRMCMQTIAFVYMESRPKEFLQSMFWVSLFTPVNPSFTVQKLK